MSETKEPRTWSVSAAVLLTPALSALMLIAIVAAAEVAARSAIVREHLRPDSLGAPFWLIDAQRHRLERFEREGGEVDCLFLGSSMVLSGIDPDVFAAQLEARTGDRIRCFNFGSQALTADEAGLMSEYLIATEHPRLLIYGPGTRDLTSVVRGQHLSDSAWARYRRGEFSIDGWLAERSYAYRYVLAYRGPTELGDVALATRVRPNGFAPADGVADAAMLARIDLFLRNQLGDFGVAPEQLAGLDAVIGLGGAETAVAVVRLPVHSRVLERLHGNADFHRGAEAIAAAAARGDAPLWDATSSVVGDDGMADLVHLNPSGAAVFSRWLADRVADAIADGQLTLGRGAGGTAADARNPGHPPR